MKIAKLLSLGLLVFALFGCNQTPATSNNDNLIESAISQEEDSDSVSKQTINDRSKLSNSDSKIVATNNNKKNKTANQIGGRFDCNGDGKANGARIDYNGDGIPDDCIEQDEKVQSVIDETSYDTVLKSLNSLTKGCQETTKTPENTKYSICKRGDKIVKASASSTTLGDGNEYWFVDNQVIAVQQFHTGELFLYDNNGKLKSKFNYPKKVRNISSQDRKIAESLSNGYDYIFEVFNNKSSAKATASQSGIIDETSFQTFSKSLEAITQGCTKTKKTENYTDYEICKKDGKVVNASEYASEADAGLAYWFATDGRVVAMRYLNNGEVFTFDSNGKVSAKFNIYDSKKINNISDEERKQAEKTANSAYQDILQRF